MFSHSGKALSEFVTRAEMAIDSILQAPSSDFDTVEEYSRWVRDLVFAAKHRAEDDVQRLIDVQKALGEEKVRKSKEMLDGIRKWQNGRSEQEEAKALPALRTHVCVGECGQSDL